jgi:hypothetical protein
MVDRHISGGEIMLGSPKKVAVGMVLSLGLAAGIGAPALAKIAYDGTWSVVISAESGACSGSYRYPVAIVNGSVRHAEPGEQLFNLRGRVGADGRVNVEVSRGDLRAHGVGRLSGSSGGGTWKSPNGCAGRWQAARRG